MITKMFSVAHFREIDRRNQAGTVPVNNVGGRGEGEIQ